MVPTFYYFVSNKIDSSLHRVGANARFAMFSILDPPLSGRRLDLVCESPLGAFVGKLGRAR